MVKRKRDTEEQVLKANGIHKRDGPLTQPAQSPTSQIKSSTTTTIQIITGAYERVLHGVIAAIPAYDYSDAHTTPSVQFSDSFLFNAHSSSIRCLALSPKSSSVNAPQSQKIILASGGADEKVNLYHLSALSPPQQDVKVPSLPTLANTKVAENPRNRELGSLLHHSSSVSALYFPTRSKLLSAGEDNTIAVSRTRDWTVLSTIKLPIPKAVGRPSGDTAPPGGAPTGVNDFAVHPSMKLMISVGKGEKCMRLWNLVTGKKAGVLNFERGLLQSVGEGRWSRGEGRKLEWSSSGEEFTVGFERGAIAFGMDSKPKCRVLPTPTTKIHQLHYIAAAKLYEDSSGYLAVSTEDGRIIICSSSHTAISQNEASQVGSSIPDSLALGQLGGIDVGLVNRVKDFEVLRRDPVNESDSALIIVTGSSDGSIRLWALREAELHAKASQLTHTDTRQVGRLLATYQTPSRITCLKAFIMLGNHESLAEEGQSEDEFDGLEDGEDESNSSVNEQ